MRPVAGVLVHPQGCGRRSSRFTSAELDARAGLGRTAWELQMTQAYMAAFMPGAAAGTPVTRALLRCRFHCRLLHREDGMPVR